VFDGRPRIRIERRGGEDAVPHAFDFSSPHVSGEGLPGESEFLQRASAGYSAEPGDGVLR
jgi:hypothetical protein